MKGGKRRTKGYEGIWSGKFVAGNNG